MATESKAVDLGKLQDAHKLAKNVLKMHQTAHQKSKMEMERAIANHDRWSKVIDDDKILVDKAAKAVLDGARSVAQG